MSLELEDLDGEDPLALNLVFASVKLTLVAGIAADSAYLSYTDEEAV